MQSDVNPRASNARPSERHHAAVWQARLIMLVMINIAQLWILAATVDAALARHYSVLLPLVISSGICFLITVGFNSWFFERVQPPLAVEYDHHHIVADLYFFRAGTTISRFE